MQCAIYGCVHCVNALSWKKTTNTQENEMRYYFTNYALTTGIDVQDADECKRLTCDDNYITNPAWSHTMCKLGRDVFDSKEAAIANAEERREKKIASLKRQIAKLESMKFEL